MTAALGLADEGFDVCLVEREADRQLPHVKQVTADPGDVEAYVAQFQMLLRQGPDVVALKEFSSSRVADVALESAANRRVVVARAEGDDAADALAVALCHCAQRRQELLEHSSG